MFYASLVDRRLIEVPFIAQDSPIVIDVLVYIYVLIDVSNCFK